MSLRDPKSRAVGLSGGIERLMGSEAVGSALFLLSLTASVSEDRGVPFIKTLRGIGASTAGVDGIDKLLERAATLSSKPSRSAGKPRVTTDSKHHTSFNITKENAMIPLRYRSCLEKGLEDVSVLSSTRLYINMPAEHWKGRIRSMWEGRNRSRATVSNLDLASHNKYLLPRVAMSGRHSIAKRHWTRSKDSLFLGGRQY